MIRRFPESVLKHELAPECSGCETAVRAPSPLPRGTDPVQTTPRFTVPGVEQFPLWDLQGGHAGGIALPQGRFRAARAAGLSSSGAPWMLLLRQRGGCRSPRLGLLSPWSGGFWARGHLSCGECKYISVTFQQGVRRLRTVPANHFAQATKPQKSPRPAETPLRQSHLCTREIAQHARMFVTVSFCTRRRPCSETTLTFTGNWLCKGEPSRGRKSCFHCK